MQTLVQKVVTIGIFMVIAQMLLHFKPSESYGKYLRFLLSLMVLAQLASPILAVFGKWDEETFLKRVLYYEESLSADAEAFTEEAEKILEKMTWQEVKTGINNMQEAGEDIYEESEAAGNIQ